MASSILNQNRLRIALLIGAAAFAASAIHAQSIEAERAALARAKLESQNAAARAQALEARAIAEQGEARKAQIEAAAVASRIQSAEANIVAAEARVRLIERLQEDLRAKLAEKQAPVVRLVAALQTLSRRPPALALVQPGSLREMVYTRAILGSVLPRLRDRTAGLRADLERGRQLRSDAGRAVTALADGRRRLDGERKALAQVAARHRQASQALAGSAIEEQDRAIAMGEEARDIGDLIGRLGEAAEVRARLETLPGPVLRPEQPMLARTAPAAPPAEVSNRLPYRLPVAGTVVTGLGEVSPTGIRARGLTLATRPDAQIVSPAGGRIVFAGPFRGFGQIVIIDHGRGWTSLLTNLAARDVRVGDSVVQGSPIGRAARVRPQVTVELRRNMRPIDIARLLG